MSEIQKMEVFISRLMRASVILSGVVVLIGFSFFLITGDDSCPVNVFEFNWVIFGDPFFSPSHIIFIGFMILVGTPLLRIAMSIIVYIRMGDKELTTITSIVFVILVISMIFGIG